MSTNPIWTSDAIHTDNGICVDVKATPASVILGQLHGEHDSYAADLHLSPEHAEAIALALLEATAKVREVDA